MYMCTDVNVRNERCRRRTKRRGGGIRWGSNGPLLCLVYFKPFRYTDVYSFVSGLVSVRRPMLLLCIYGCNNECVPLHAVSNTERYIMECARCIISTQGLESEFRRCKNSVEQVNMMIPYNT